MSHCIVILEDHPLYAAGLKEIAEQLIPHSEVVCEASLDDGLFTIRQHRPLLVISDLHLPGGQGLETLRLLKAHAPDTLVVGITGDIQLLSSLDSASADGTLILPKTESIDKVFDAILARMQADERAAAECRMRLPRSNVWSIDSDNRHLTRKQQAVLSLMGQGLSNKEIARRLQISPETVKSHAKSLYRQLGVKNRTQAAGQIRRLMRA